MLVARSHGLFLPQFRLYISNINVLMGGTGLLVRGLVAETVSMCRQNQLKLIFLPAVWGCSLAVASFENKISFCRDESLLFLELWSRWWRTAKSLFWNSSVFGFVLDGRLLWRYTYTRFPYKFLIDTTS